MSDAAQVLDAPAEAARPHVTVLRSAADVEREHARLKAVRWGRYEADPDAFTAVLDAREESIRPHVILVERGGELAGALVLRLERVPLESRFGYVVVHRPTVRCLTLVHGGVIGTEDEEIARVLLRELERELAAGEADVAVLPSLRTDSALHRLATTAPPALRRSHFAELRPHHLLALPESLDALLAGRSRKARYNIRRYEDLLRKGVPELRLELLAEPGQLDRIMRELEHVAAKTYQRGLGFGFADRADMRRLVELSLGQGWFRTWVAYDGDTPIAFWQGHVYGRTFYSSNTGYDAAYEHLRVGAFIHMRLIEALCLDPAVDVIDWGHGDADYKRRFASETWLEADAAIFAPRARGLYVSGVATAVQSADRLARRVAGSLGVTQRVKRAWRDRLRES